jgi:hypothetical protein
VRRLSKCYRSIDYVNCQLCVVRITSFEQGEDYRKAKDRWELKLRQISQNCLGLIGRHPGETCSDGQPVALLQTPCSPMTQKVDDNEVGYETREDNVVHCCDEPVTGLSKQVSASGTWPGMCTAFHLRRSERLGDNGQAFQ